MAVDTCILAKAAQGLVDERKAAKLAQEVTERIEEFKQNSGNLGPEAERVLANRVLQEKLRTLVRKKRMAVLHKRVLAKNDGYFNEAKNRGVGVDLAMTANYSQDLSRRLGFIDDVESRTANIRGDYQGKMAEVFQTFRSKFAGITRDLSELRPTIHEAFGKRGRRTGNAHAEVMGRAMREMAEYARNRYNAAGGDIPFREDWGWFQTHDPSRMTEAGREAWIDFIYDRLDIPAMRDANGLPMSPKQVRNALNHIYDGTVSRGLSDLAGKEPGPGQFGSNINQRANSRFLIFKDSDAFLDYHDRFGRGNLYENIITSMDQMARDTAILEILGPYPEATLRYQERLIDRAAAEDALSKTGKAARKAAEKVGAPKTQIRALFNTVTGRTGMSENETLSYVAATARGIVTSASLGGAFFSAIADTATSGLTARMTGLSPMRVWGRTLKTFSTNSTADRRLAADLGFGVQGWASRAIAAQRVLGESIGAGWAERMTDTVLRASWLSPWTEAGRVGWQIEMLGHITRNSHLPFDKLPRELATGFRSHGMTAEMWEAIRNTPAWRHEETGGQFIRPEDVMGGEFEGIRFEAANKLKEIVLREMEYAVPGANARVRAAFTQGAPAGTIWGEIMRNTALFKSFPISVHMMHWRRLWANQDARSPMEYAAWLFIGMSALGVMGEQLTSISRGRDPEPLSSPDLWRRAVIRGGSFGLMGDVLLADGRFGVNMDTLIGPVWSLVNQGVNLTFGNVAAYLSENDTHAGRDLSRFIEQNMPGRSIWYSRLAFERLVFDNLDQWLDPEANAEFAKVERNYRRNRGQEFFSKPGRGIRPQRGPDFGKLFEAAP